MSISKIKKLKLETTAEYQPISELNVSFFNQDINTSVLDFIVMRNDSPIPLGVDNIEATIVLTSNKFKISDEVQIKDGMNGILTYTLPDDILERPGKVTGQIYIGIKGKEDTVVQRLFSFDIEDSLINSFDAETKLVYIRKFDKLEAEISQRVESIEQAIAHSEDYVTKVIQEKDIALSQIDERKINILEEMTTLFDTEKSNLQAIGEGYKTNFEQVDVELNQKIEDIKREINPETYVTQIQSEKWQKYSFTEDDGQRIRVSDIDPVDLDTGYYQIWHTYNMPPDTDDGSYSYWNVDVLAGADNTKQILAVLSGNGKAYLKNIHKGHDRGWKELTNSQTDTGWLDVMLKNDVNTESTVMYKIVTINGTKQVSIKGEVFNVPENTEINFGKLPNIETIGTPYIINTFPSDIKMWIENDGEMKVLAPVGWKSEDTINFSATLIL